jgi:hypothetical protein
MRREVEHGVFLLGISREVIQGGICCEYSVRPVCVLRSSGTRGEGIGRTRDEPAANLACSSSQEERFCAVSIVLKLKKIHFQ